MDNNHNRRTLAERLNVAPEVLKTLSFKEKCKALGSTAFGILAISDLAHIFYGGGGSPTVFVGTAAILTGGLVSEHIATKRSRNKHDNSPESPES